MREDGADANGCEGRMTAEGLVKGGFISLGAVCREW